MKTGLKLVIIGIVLLCYWLVAIYAKIVLIEILILEQESETPSIPSLDSTVNPLEYPWWWFVIRIGDYAGMAGFILVIVGIVKSYIDWRFVK